MLHAKSLLLHGSMFVEIEMNFFFHSLFAWDRATVFSQVKFQVKYIVAITTILNNIVVKSPSQVFSSDKLI